MAGMEPGDEIIVGIHGFFGQRRADIFFANPNYAGGGN
jgi:aspartate aminotransferase-like enzyme